MFQRSERILPNEEPAVSSVIEDVFEAEGIDVHTGKTVEQLADTDDGIEVTATADGETTSVTASDVLIAAGR
jgi:mercuric reductase